MSRAVSDKGDEVAVTGDVRHLPPGSRIILQREKLIPDITAHKKVGPAAELLINVREVQEIACIGQLVVVYKCALKICFFEQMPDEIRTDKPCSIGALKG